MNLNRRSFLKMSGGALFVPAAMQVVGINPDSEVLVAPSADQSALILGNESRLLRSDDMNVQLLSMRLPGANLAAPMAYMSIEGIAGGVEGGGEARFVALPGNEVRVPRGQSIAMVLHLDDNGLARIEMWRVGGQTNG